MYTAVQGGVAILNNYHNDYKKLEFKEFQNADQIPKLSQPSLLFNCFPCNTKM